MEPSTNLSQLVQTTLEYFTLQRAGRIGEMAFGHGTLRYAAYLALKEIGVETPIEYTQWAAELSHACVQVPNKLHTAAAMSLEPIHLNQIMGKSEAEATHIKEQWRFLLAGATEVLVVHRLPALRTRARRLYISKHLGTSP